MIRSWRRGCAILAAACLLCLIGGCVLLGVGVRARAIGLPPVLLHTSYVWIGDRCRAYLNSPAQAERACPPGYVVDVVMMEAARPHYVLIQIPLE